MRYGSVCSGIEAATAAWHPLGWEPTFFSEIEPFPCAVLKHHYPNVPNLGDMTKFKEWPYAPGDIDLLVGGTPCQSFSVAGLRKGLDDPRGNLMLTFGAIAEHFKPTWIVWENVPGVLSSNKGRDFGTFLGMLAELGYGFAYRILDAQYFGLAQRRRRVFVVGYLGDWRRAAAVLFEPESLQGNPAPSREKGEGVAGCLASGAKSSGGIGYDNQALFSQNGDNLIRPDDIAACLRSGGNGGVPSSRGEHLVFDTTQVTSPLNYSNPKPGDPCHPLAAGAHVPAIAFGQNRTSGPVEISHALNAHAGPHGRLNFESETFLVHNRQDPVFEKELCQPLGAKDNGTAVAVAYHRNASCQVTAQDEVTAALRSEAEHSYQFIQNKMQVRRLTATECEFLQGFPRGYTNIPWRNKPESPDGPRYKALGNSMAVPVMRWIGERIQLIETMEVSE